MFQPVCSSISWFAFFASLYPKVRHYELVPIIGKLVRANTSLIDVHEQEIFVILTAEFENAISATSLEVLNEWEVVVRHVSEPLAKKYAPKLVSRIVELFNKTMFQAISSAIFRRCKTILAVLMRRFSDLFAHWAKELNMCKWFADPVLFPFHTYLLIPHFAMYQPSCIPNYVTILDDILQANLSIQKLCLEVLCLRFGSDPQVVQRLHTIAHGQDEQKNNLSIATTLLWYLHCELDIETVASEIANYLFYIEDETYIHHTERSILEAEITATLFYRAFQSKSLWNAVNKSGNNIYGLAASIAPYIPHISTYNTVALFDMLSRTAFWSETMPELQEEHQASIKSLLRQVPLFSTISHKYPTDIVIYSFEHDLDCKEPPNKKRRLQ